MLLCTSAACDDFISGLSRGYVGPPPAHASIVDEVATLAEVRAGYQGQVVLILDRTRFASAGDPHNVNRVVKAWTTRENQHQVTALNLRSGDRVLISTEFNGIDEAGGSMNVPNWPGHDALEYPISSHQITSIERVSP
jgi:hypothetical protein